MKQRGPAYGADDTKFVQWLWKDGLEHIMSLAIRIVEWGPLRLCSKTGLEAETSVCHTSITSFYTSWADFPLRNS